MWQVDMRSVVLCVRDCALSVLHAAAVTADADSDPTSVQPSCGWNDVIFIHSCCDDDVST